MGNDEIKIQERLFDRVSKILPSSISLVDSLADILGISIDSAYRRLRGETLLSIHETSLICKTLNISFDSLFDGKGNFVTFDFTRMSDEESYKKYLRSIINELRMISESENKQIIYAAEDIPLFHNFGFPVLASFKLFYWMKSIMNVKSLQGIKYDPSIIDDEILELGKEVYNYYARIPSIEIWTEITPVSLYKQIEFFWDAGIFRSRDDAVAICDQVKDEFSVLEKQAELGRKVNSEGKVVTGENSYMLYWSEIEIGNNCILAEIEQEKTVYLAYNTFNKLTTRNNNFCEEIDAWLKNLIKKSTLISDVSEKQRYQFFKTLNSGIDKVRNKIVSS